MADERVFAGMNLARIPTESETSAVGARPRTRSCGLAIALLLLLAVPRIAACASSPLAAISIEEPVAGALILPSESAQGTIRVCGTYQSPIEAPVELRISAADLDCTETTVRCQHTTAVRNGRWCVERVRIGWRGVTKLTATAGGSEDSIYLTGSPVNLRRQPQQTVGLVWEGVDGQLQRMAQETMDTVSTAQADAFPTRVQERVRELLSSWLSAFDLPLVTQQPLYTIRFTTNDDSFWGLTDLRYADCGNLDLHGESSVHVGTFARSLSTELEKVWWPMKRQDHFDTRSEDIAYALATTAFHELMHGLGLLSCPWMATDKSDPGHNNRDLDAGTRGRDYGIGWSLLDSGAVVLGHHRLGIRTTDRHLRQPRQLGPMSARYVAVLHGKSQ